MPKRPSIIDQVELVSPAIETPTPARAATPLTNPDVHKTSLYIPSPAYERLREIAFTKRCKVHDLFMEGIDLVIAKHGHSEKASRS